MILTSEHIIHQLFKTAADYARQAVELDRSNQFEQAMTLYIGAAEHLQRILDIEQNEKMRDMYFRKAKLYLTRAKELREIIKGPIVEEEKIDKVSEEILPSVTKIDEAPEEMLPSVSQVTEEETVLPVSNIQELLKKGSTHADKANEYEKAGQFTDAVSNYLSAAESFQKLYELTNEKEYFTSAKEYLVLAKELRYNMIDKADPLAQEISDLIYEAFDIKKKLKLKMKEYNIDDPITLKLALTELQDKELQVHPTYEDYLSLQALEHNFKELLSRLDIYLAELQEKPVSEKVDSVSIKERYNEFATIVASEAADLLKDAPSVFIDRIEIVFIDNSHLKIYYPTDSEYSFYWKSKSEEEIFNVNAIVPNAIASPEVTPKENILNYLNEIRKKIAI